MNSLVGRSLVQLTMVRFRLSCASRRPFSGFSSSPSSWLRVSGSRFAIARLTFYR